MISLTVMNSKSLSPPLYEDKKGDATQNTGWFWLLQVDEHSTSICACSSILLTFHNYVPVLHRFWHKKRDIGPKSPILIYP